MGLFKKKQVVELPSATALVLTMTSKDQDPQEHRFSLQPGDYYHFDYDDLKIFSTRGQLIDFFKPQAGFSVHYHVIYGEIEKTRKS